MSKAPDLRPTFQELRLKHGITLEAIYEYTGQCTSMEAIVLLDQTGRGTPMDVDDLLYCLSRLSGERYNRSNVGQMTFILSTRGTAQLKLPPPSVRLSERPAFIELVGYYSLDLSRLADAAALDERLVQSMVLGHPIKRADLEKVLAAISDYTGVDYTLDTVTVFIEEEHQVHCTARANVLAKMNQERSHP